MLLKQLLVSALAVFVAAPGNAHPCVDRILSEDGSLNRDLVEEMFGALGPVSHIASAQGFFREYDITHPENGFAALFGDAGLDLPSGMVLLGRHVIDRKIVTLKYQCPFVDTPRALCLYDPAAIEVRPTEFDRPFGPTVFPRIQRPETSTGPVVRWALNEARDHYCNYGLSLTERGEPFDLSVFETRPARHALERWSLGMQNDPTPGQYARGVYVWNFQFDEGKFDDFVR